MTWAKHFENPTVLAATVASFATLAIGLLTALSGAWTQYVQTKAEVAKARISADSDNQRSIRDTKRALIIAAFDKTPSAQDKLLGYIKSGVLEDQDCKLRIAILNYTSDCQPPASK